MALLENILFHGVIAAALMIAYLLPIMRLLSPRIWAMSDYPKEITTRVEPQTKKEQRIAILMGIPFIFLMIAFPLVSTLILETTYAGGIPIADAFLNTFGVLMFANLADLVILDLLIVGTITPSWVIIPGTEDMKDTVYKAFRKEHSKSHIRGTIFMAILSLVIAFAVVVF
ncbi:MAG: nitroreductase [Candidatus Thorarchaeota archaeon]|nr:nitroreductase [Candidatus Thorarchaeota archaeon]